MWDSQEVKKETTLFEIWNITLEFFSGEFEARLKHDNSDVVMAYGVDEQDTLENLSNEIESFIEGLNKVKEKVNEEAKQERRS